MSRLRVPLLLFGLTLALAALAGGVLVALSSPPSSPPRGSGDLAAPSNAAESPGRERALPPVRGSLRPTQQAPRAESRTEHSPNPGPDDAPAGGPDPTTGTESTTTTLAAATPGGDQQAPAGTTAPLAGANGATARDLSNPSGADAGPPTVPPAGEMIATAEADPAPPTGDGAITGAVLRGDRPVDAVLSLNLEGTAHSWTTRTDASGFYFFDGLVEGSYRLRLESPAAPHPTRGVTLSGEGQVRTIDFLLPPGLPVRGEVVRAADGQPVSGANVHLHDEDGAIGHALSGADGYFELFAVDPGSYQVRVSAEGYRPATETFAVGDDGAAPLLAISLEGGLAVEGTASLQDVSPGVVPVYVLLMTPDAMAVYPGTSYVYTRGGGRFSIGLDPETATAPLLVAAWAPNHAPVFVGPVTPDAIAPSYDLRVPEGVAASGRVVDADGVPVDGATVLLAEEPPEARAVRQHVGLPLVETIADTQGHFELRGLLPGRPHVLRIAAEGFIATDVDVLSTADVDLGDVMLEATEETAPGRLFGTIVDERGTFLRGHAVYTRSASGHEASTLTDSTGGFRLDGLPEEPLLVMTNGAVVRDGVYITMDQTVAGVVPGGPAVYIVYDLGTSAGFRAVGVGGEPLTTVTATVRVRDDRAGGATTGLGYTATLQDATGSFVLEHLPAGLLTLDLEAPGGGRATVGPARVPVGGRLELGDILLSVPGS